ncbi:hypothetical protein BZL30_8026 [Mycobacterium kansasii]|uniref:Uncharacterized protein n=1 Tax=Mycobacterium kansasii TaxID=1768 RepID=A0A1V3WI88_MYCKA|nr:hypothetical protein BZL30_8026 [Mycobacterium kansasii]
MRAGQKVLVHAAAGGSVWPRSNWLGTGPAGFRHGQSRQVGYPAGIGF